MFAGGIDPGKTGALVLVGPEMELVEVVDMPVIDKRLSVFDLNSVLTGWRTQAQEEGHTLAIAMEKPFSLNMGSTSALNYGIAYGQLLQAAVTIGDSFLEVRPQDWQSDLGCSVSGPAGPAKRKRIKERSRLLCQERWPEQAGLFNRVKDDGRADAANIAYWRAT